MNDWRKLIACSLAALALTVATGIGLYQHWMREKNMKKDTAIEELDGYEQTIVFRKAEEE